MLRLSKRYNSFLSQLLNSKTVHELLLTTEAPTTPTTVQGWVRSFRPLKNVSFIDLQDGTSNEALKIVVPNTNGSLPSLKTGQSIVVSNAAWRWTPNREQPFELSCSPSDLRIVGDITPEYPLQKKHTTLKQLRQWPLWKHRTTYLGGLMRFRSHLERELFNILSNEGVYRVHTPILTGVDCEGAGELFNVGSKSNQNYFGKETYLTVSTQLHLEILALAMNRVWSLSPCFRAEGSDTSRHLAEFWMLEAEVCFMDNVHQLTAFLEHLLKSLINSLIENHSNLIPQLTPQDNVSPGTKVLEKWQSLVAKKWENITYTEATELLKAQHSRSAFVHPPEWGNALQSEHEKWLAECKFNGPVFVTDYPHSCKAFYMKRGEDGKTATCFDLLVPGMGEISSGSIREDNYDKLITSMQERQMNLEQMKWYTDLRKQGSLPHGGFGIGMERLVTWLYGAHNVRDSIPFHRSATSAIEL